MYTAMGGRPWIFKGTFSTFALNFVPENIWMLVLMQSWFFILQFLHLSRQSGPPSFLCSTCGCKSTMSHSQCRSHNLLAVLPDPSLHVFVLCHPDSARLPVKINLPLVEAWTGMDLVARWEPYFVFSWCFKINKSHLSTYSNFEFTAGIQ